MSDLVPQAATDASEPHPEGNPALEAAAPHIAAQAVVDERARIAGWLRRAGYDAAAAEIEDRMLDNDDE